MNNKKMGISGDSKTLRLISFALLLSFVCATGCSKTSLEKIKESGKITVITENGANSYYIYQDVPMGFEYDLVKAFAKYLGVDLEVITPGWNNMFDSLNNGQGDLIAASLTITHAREERVEFSDPYMDVQQHLIIHKDNRTLKNQEDVNGKDIYVRKGTSYHDRLLELKEEGLYFNLVLHENTPTEEFLRQVAEKEIEATVADSSLALINRRYYPDLRIAFPIEEEQSLGWAVRKGDREFADKINEFFDTINENGMFGKIYEKYYANVEVFDYVDLKKFHTRLSTKLPQYKKTIKKAADKYGFDWRFIAAIVYQESHFNPKARSHTGVRGLMQLTQNTAKAMGVKNRLDPAESIMGGVKYLKKLYSKYDGINEPDRMLITLASYNVGRGHIIDAQKIARQKGLNPDSWAALEQVLPLLRYSKYYKRTKYGYCRGTEPVRYVKRVLTYYDIIRRKAITLEN